MPNRRRFLKLAAIGSSSAVIGYSAFKIATPFSRAISNMILKDLDWMNIDPSDVEQFSLHAVKSNPWNLHDIEKRVIGFYDSPLFKRLPLPYKSRYMVQRQEIVKTYLLSTDFFLNKMDESRPVKYLGRVWGPYNTPCLNPFSSLFYTAT